MIHVFRLVSSAPSFSANDLADDLEKLEELLQNYNAEIPPTKSEDEPTVVTINAFIISFGSISASSMDYSVDCFFRQSWNDHRLAMDDLSEKYLHVSKMDVINKIWQPGVYFKNVKQTHFHTVPTPNIFLRIDAKGNILLSMRLTMKLSCQMELQYYPQDIQECFINIGVYTYQTSVVVLKWSDKYPIEIQDDVQIPEFYFPKIEVNDRECIDHYTTGDFSCLSAKFKLAREYNYHIIQTYVPMILITMVSWVSCWLDPGAIPARVTLGVTTLLSLTTIASGVRGRLPPVSYVKAIDVWMGACMTYVFASLLQFTLVNYLYRRKEDGEDKFRKAKSLDWTCRIFFPVSFTLFLIAYFYCYTDSEA